MHSYIHTFIHTYIYIIHIYTYIYTHTYIHTYKYTYLITSIQTHIHTYIHTYIRKYVRTYVSTYVNIHTYTHTHTYIYTYIEALITRGCPQGSCCGPGMWNIYYNSLLNLNFTHRTKTIAFADDLILAIRGRTVTEAENMANIELTKISAWARENKIHFNEQKAKTILISRRKRKERKDVMIYLNPPPTGTKPKIPRYYTRHETHI